MEKIQDQKSSTLHDIIEEVDAAREVYQLYHQMSKALPIREFDDLRKACDKEGNLHFRDAKVNLSFFKNYVPDFIFPIEDEKGLIQRLAQFVKLMPEHLGYSTENPENQKRYSQLQFLSSFFGKVNVGSVLSRSVFQSIDISNQSEKLKNLTPE